MALKKAAKQAVTAHHIQRKEVIMTIVGDGLGYISNAFPLAAIEKMEDKATGKGGAKAAGPRSPKEEFEATLRLDGKGRACIPGGGIKKALINAAPAVDLTKVFVRGVLYVQDPLVVIEGSKPNMRRDTCGRGHLTYRAFFPTPWKAKVPILFDSARLSLEQLVDLVNSAGFSVGIGNWRPECNGMFGMFHVEGG